jgi:hypothetical protein
MSRPPRTNAEDSAPGVNDGPAGVPPTGVSPAPGRAFVWIAIVIVCLIVLIAFVTRPLGTTRGASGEATGPVTTQAQGASSPPAPAAPGNGG